jgi:hypothetical protein
MLQITLTQSAHDKPFGQMSEDELFRAATEAWVMNPQRADKERYARIIADGKCVMALRLQGTELVWEAPKASSRDNRYRLLGEILHAGDPVYDACVGEDFKGTRNPIRYCAEPFDLSPCRCGCDEVTRSEFLPGHDQRALHQCVAKFGSVGKFLDWFDATYPDKK